MKYGQKLKLGDAHVNPRNIQEVQASKLGMPQGTPSSSAKIRSPFKTLYFYCFIYYAFFLERLYFRFQFSTFQNLQNTSCFVTLFSAHGDVVVGFAIFHIAYSKKKK
jgi:hypothetical protein